MLRDHGSGVRYHHDLIGFNGRLDEIQAVVLRAKLPYLARWNELRREHARLYSELLRGTPAKTPAEFAGSTPVYHLYVISTPKRNELQVWLKDHGIFTGIHYPIPLHLQKAMEFLGYRQGDLPVTERVAANILSLPMFAELGEDEIEYVVDQIKEFYDKHAS
jgi:dTDP-4-amino-4,6-dideoxygalactose transaminase